MSLHKRHYAMKNSTAERRPFATSIKDRKGIKIRPAGADA